MNDFQAVFLGPICRKPRLPEVTLILQKNSVSDRRKVLIGKFKLDFLLRTQKAKTNLTAQINVIGWKEYVGDAMVVCDIFAKEKVFKQD